MSWSNRAKKSVAGLLFRRRYELCDDATVATDRSVTTLMESRNLCPGETFGDQYGEAFCSAALIDEDLVMTAAHCVDGCAGLVFGFGMYLEDVDTHRPLTPDDFYGCRRVVERAPVRDIVIMQLDRPVADTYEPVPLSSTALQVGDGVGVIGFPSGVPMKIARSCEITHEPTAMRIRNNCDVFPGNSGSGLFNETTELVGVVTTAPSTTSETVIVF